MRWAEAHGVGSLVQMLALLTVQPAQWREVLEALAPTKSYHKSRLLTKLKRATEGEALPPVARHDTTHSYWSAIDEPASATTGVAERAGEPLQLEPPEPGSRYGRAAVTAVAAVAAVAAVTARAA